MIKPSAIVVFANLDPLLDSSDLLESPALDQGAGESLMSLTLRHYSAEFIKLMTLANVLWVMMALALLIYVIHNAMKYLLR